MVPVQPFAETTASSASMTARSAPGRRRRPNASIMPSIVTIASHQLCANPSVSNRPSLWKVSIGRPPPGTASIPFGNWTVVGATEHEVPAGAEQVSATGALKPPDPTTMIGTMALIAGCTGPTCVLFGTMVKLPRTTTERVKFAVELVPARAAVTLRAPTVDPVVIVAAVAYPERSVISVSVAVPFAKAPVAAPAAIVNTTDAFCTGFPSVSVTRAIRCCGYAVLMFAVWLLPLNTATLAAAEADTFVQAVVVTVGSLVSVAVTHCGPAVFNVTAIVCAPASEVAKV